MTRLAAIKTMFVMLVIFIASIFISGCCGNTTGCCTDTTTYTTGCGDSGSW
jgi:hypothetical protein